LVHDQDPEVRASALAALERLDPSALGEHVLLRIALDDSNGVVRDCAMRAIVNWPAAVLAQHVPALLKLLEDTYIAVPRLAMEALQKLDDSVLAAHTLLPLSTVLDTGRPQFLRERAATGLRLWPPAALAPYLSNLLGLLDNGDRNSRTIDTRSILESIDCTLQKLVASMPASVVASVLKVQYKGKDQAPVRQAALDRVISQLPAETLRLHTPLPRSMLLDRHAVVRESALRTLCKLDPSELAKENSALLVLGLLDSVPAVRRAAMRALCRLPPESLAPHAAEVLRMLLDPAASVQQKAVRETERMVKTFQAPVLKEQLRRAAVEACTSDGVLGTLR
jgi:vesicle coat complex subunit